MAQGLIDLHTHSTASDGTDTPEQLVRRAASLGVSTLAMTDHDTLDGVDSVIGTAAQSGLTLIRGIELSTRVSDESDLRRRNAHLLAYFLSEPGPAFRTWLQGLRKYRRERNQRIAERLQELGVAVTLQEAEALGRNITARPHFAAVMIRKGYVSNVREAFDRYLGETGQAYVEREDPPVEEAIRRARAAGGVTSLAHAIRLNQPDPAREMQLISTWAKEGLDALEVWHTDHGEADEIRYGRIADACGLARTGGSDFHGEHTPGILPGTGKGRLRVPASVLDDFYRIALGRMQDAGISGLATEIGQRPHDAGGR
jgi:predicted metal-dependent phosphoesterase TrpH